jgi:hypothetical protein
MLFREICSIYCDDHMKHTNRMCGQNAELMYVKACNILYFIYNCYCTYICVVATLLFGVNNFFWFYLTRHYEGILPLSFYVTHGLNKARLEVLTLKSKRHRRRRRRYDDDDDDANLCLCSLSSMYI